MAAPQRRWAAEILHFWFHRLRPVDWFRPGPEVDAALRTRFERELTMLGARPAAEFLTDPQTARAAVLLFDQVPRNIYRARARSFEFDPLACAITRAALLRGFDAGLGGAERQFLAMPLMHSEDIADQLWSIDYFTRLGPRFGAPFARSHFRMIARFGRYPHRNAVLGRESSTSEVAAIAAGNQW